MSSRSQRAADGLILSIVFALVLFVGFGETVAQETLSKTPNTDLAGVTSAIAGDVNGDGYDDVFVQENFGGVALHLGGLDGLTVRPAWFVEFRIFGAAGDVNGDGFDDILVGDFLYDDPTNTAEVDEGRVLLFLGTATVPSTTPDMIIEGNSPGLTLGGLVGTAGDVNGDDYADVFIGAADAVFIHHGCEPGVGGCPASGLMDVPASTLADVGSDLEGNLVRAAGDANADGFSDLLLTGSVGNAQCGPCLFLGSAGGLSTVIAEFDDIFNVQSLALAGDVNQDGYSDFISGGTNNFDTARLYVGSATGFNFDAWGPNLNLQEFANIGDAVAGGDFNGDGHGDILVGAPSYENPDSPIQNEGRAFLFTGSPTGPSNEPSWFYEGVVENSFTGNSLSAADVNGDGFSDAIVATGGRLLVFHGRGGGLPTVSRWTRSSLIFPSVDSAFDLNGDGYTDLVLSDLFRFYIHYGSEAGLPNLADASGDGFDGRTQAGGAGDVDGDGYSDVLIADEEFAYLFSGSAAGIVQPANPTTASWSAPVNGPFTGFVPEVDGAGDVDGDGFGDALVGIELYRGCDSGDAACPGGLDATFGWAAARGTTARGAGDVNGDGFSDVVVTGDGYADGYLGSASGLSQQPVWSVDLPDLASAETAGDVNGDGYSDVIVGAPRFDVSEEDEGRAYLFLGSPAGLETRPVWIVEGASIRAQLGTSVGAAGDVNNDGFGDVIVGGKNEFGQTPSVEEGYTAAVYLGSADGLTMAPGFETASTGVDMNIGVYATGAGDVNGDGYADVVIGSDFSPPLGFYGGGSDSANAWSVRQLAVGTDRPLGLLGRSDSADSARLAMRGRTAAGRARTRIQWEAKPIGVPFDGLNLGQGEVCPCEDMGAGSTCAITSCEAVVSGLDVVQGTCDDGSTCTSGSECQGIGGGTCSNDQQVFYRWRARLVTDSPYFPQTPWISLPGNTVTEAKLKTAAPLPSPRFGLVGPNRNQRVFSDASAPTFSWNRGAANAYRIDWSRNPDFEYVTESSAEIPTQGPGQAQAYTPDAAEWAEILELAQQVDQRDIPIFWRAVPSNSSAADLETAVFSAMRLSAAQGPSLLSPLDNEIFLPLNRPTLRWMANGSDRFQVRFSSQSNIGDPRIIVGQNFDIAAGCVPDPLAPAVCTWEVPQQTWDELIALVEGSGSIYWVVLARDSLDRQTFSRIRSVEILNLGAAPLPDLPRGPRTDVRDAKERSRR